MARVAVFMGSASDEGVMRPCADLLDKLGIDHLFTITSAHRTPERTARLVAELEAGGCQVFICGAGMGRPHWPGPWPPRPPSRSSACPSTPRPCPAWTPCWPRCRCPRASLWPRWPWDKAGARNAAWLAAQILALNDPELAGKLAQARAEFAQTVEKAADDLQS